MTVNRVAESLGSGQYGEVYCGRWLAGRGGPVEVVIKTFSPEKGKNNLEFLREAMVLEFLPNGELRHFLHSFICE